MIKLKDILNELHIPLHEDWFDEYLAYVDKVFKELKKRFNIRNHEIADLTTFFGDHLERGWKKNINPKKLAFVMIPKGQTYNIKRF